MSQFFLYSVAKEIRKKKISPTEFPFRMLFFPIALLFVCNIIPQPKTNHQTARYCKRMLLFWDFFLHNWLRNSLKGPYKVRIVTENLITRNIKVEVTEMTFTASFSVFLEDLWDHVFEVLCQYCVRNSKLDTNIKRKIKENVGKN